MPRQATITQPRLPWHLADKAAIRMTTLTDPDTGTNHEATVVFDGTNTWGTQQPLISVNNGQPVINAHAASLIKTASTSQPELAIVARLHVIDPDLPERAAFPVIARMVTAMTSNRRSVALDVVPGDWTPDGQIGLDWEGVTLPGLDDSCWDDLVGQIIGLLGEEAP